MAAITSLLILAVSIEVGITWGGWHGLACFLALVALRAIVMPRFSCAECKFYREEGGRKVCHRFIEPIVGGYFMAEPGGYCSEGGRKDA